MRRKEAPAPIRLSLKAVGWRESELRNWLDNRPSAR
ncbi:MAG: AlpA family phage regulatory protein [Burkholderiaceae bacterium]|nr:AlpA family phage regulatory protein [Burkholderiaceae bacterium]